MDKDFDFEKDLDFDADAFLESDDFDADIDLSQFSDLDLDADSDQPLPQDGEDELNLDDLDALLGEEPVATPLRPELPLSDEEEEDLEPQEPEFELEDFDLEQEEDLGEEFGDEPDFPDGLFGKKADIYQNAPQEPEEFPEEPDFPSETELPQEELPEEPAEEPEVPQEQPEERRPRRERKPREPKQREEKAPREHKPNALTKLFDLYFGPVVDKEQFQKITNDPAKPRRRRKSKQQIFKEVYLPPIIACVALIMVLAFVIGAISNAIDQKQLKADQEKQQLQESLDQAQQEQAEYQAVMNRAAELALSYNYDDAISVLESFSGYANYPEMATKRAEYVTARDSMVEYKDASQLVNLSFHPLIVDTARAFADVENGGSYNKNFVTVGEFQKILEQLYTNNYVLVDFNSFVGVTQTISGEDQFQMSSILLPSGKKPIMITETLMGYYQYMVDPDRDGTPDAKGAGFANKLVLDDYGNIKAAYVDASGNNLVGDYDLVPILENFIAQHPDFSYKGARAILATTGDEGIFGYRCNTSFVSSKGNEYYEQEKAGAQTIVNALKQKGYTLASFTYGNANYRNLNATQISADLQSWTSQITPIIGDIDVFVFARGVDLSDYTGAAYKAMYQTGFRYFISSGKTGSTTINNTYVHQNRLMVTGEYMAWYSDRFKDLFDSNLVLDMAARGDVPKSG